MLKLRILDRPPEISLPGVEQDPGVYVWRDPAGRPCAYGHSTGGQHWMHWPTLASYRFDDEGGEVLAYRAGSASPTIITDTFHRMVLPLALQRRGLEALHASSVVIGGRVVVFCAASGTGKSTLAYALSRIEGHRQWSDDAVVFDARTMSVMALPFDVRLLPEAAACLSGSRPLGSVASGSHPVASGSHPVASGSHPVASGFSRKKTRATSSAANFRLKPEATQEDEDQRPLGTICILGRLSEKHADADLIVTPLAGSRALAAVLEHAHCFNLTDHARKKLMLEHYLDLVERVPIYDVRFRPGFERLPAVAAELTRTFGSLERP